MSLAARTTAFSKMQFARATDRSSAQFLHWKKAAWAALLVGIVFFVSDHDWLTSRFEDYTTGSDFMETVTKDGNFLRRTAIFGLGLASLFLLFRRDGYQLKFRGLLALLLTITMAWCAASVFWAIDPGLAVRRLISAGCVVLAALAAARLLTPRELTATAVICSAGYLAIGILAELSLGTFQPWSGTYRFAGTMHPNNQGLNCVLLIMTAGYLAVYIPQHRQALWALVVAGFVGLWITKSRTPLAALVVAELLVWLFSASWQKKIAWSLGAIFVTCSLMLFTGDAVFRQIATTAELGRTNEDNPGTLSGRLPLWEELGDFVASRPLIGYGYSSFWTSQNIEEISASQSWSISVAHSSYLDLTLGIGLIGAGLGVAIILLGVFQALQWHVISPAAGYGFIAVLLVFALIHGLTESAFANPGFVPLVALAGLAMLAFVDSAQYAGELPLQGVSNS